MEVIELKNQMAETDNQIAKRMARTDMQIAETDDNVKRMSSKLESVGHSNGIVAETFFKEATKEGITLKIGGKEAKFDQIAVNLTIDNAKANPKAELDILMTNCDYVLVTETKYRLDKQHMPKMLNRVEQFKKYRPEAVKGKKIVTAFASLGVEKEVKDYFRENGHFVFTEKNNQLNISYPRALCLSHKTEPPSPHLDLVLD